MPPTFIPRYCPSLQTEILFVLRKGFQYTKYAFNPKTDKFRAVVCNCCHLEASERQLHPIYAVWSHVLHRHVIFAQNVLTGRIEQFVYDKTSQSFEEVRQPELRFDGAQYESPTNVLFAAGGADSEDAVTLILKDDVAGCLRKERFNTRKGRFEAIPARPVRFLRVKEEPPVKIYVPIASIKRILKSRVPPMIFVPKPPPSIRRDAESIPSIIQKIKKPRNFFSESGKTTSVAPEPPKRLERKVSKVYSEAIYEDEV